MMNKFKRSFAVILDSLSDYDGWDLYNNIDPKSPELGWENFTFDLANFIHDCLTENECQDIDKSTRLMAELEFAERTRDSAIEDIENIKNELEKLNGN